MLALALSLEPRSDGRPPFKDDSLLYFLWGFLCAVLIALLAQSCAAPVYQPNVLADQVIYPHPDSPGLVNRSCALYLHSGECGRWLVQIQDTSDPKVRESLQRLTFVCNVGGKMYDPCLDRNGLCRTTYGPPKYWIVGPREKKVDFLSLEKGPDKDFLIAAKTTCSRFGRYASPVGF
jgi:hypothetical protein